MAFRAQNVSRAFEKLAPGTLDNGLHREREREKKNLSKLHTKNAAIPDSPKYIIAAHVDAMTAPGRLPGIVGQA